MAKKRTSVSLDPDVYAFIQDDGTNASGLINNLVREYIAGGTDKGMLELRRSQIKANIESLESQLKTERNQLQRVESKLAEQRHEMDSIIDEARAAIDDDIDDSENPAIQNWADKANLTPEELLDEL